MYKILIVDDEIENLQLIFDIIRKSGEEYQIQRAFDVVSALAIAEKIIPDLIITDWEMPEINGIDFIKTLKKTEKLNHIPVIMCTGIMTNSKNLKTALEAGAVDFIRKPIDDIELIARIKSTILLINSFKQLREKEQIILQQQNELVQSKLDKKNRELTSYAILLSKKNNEIIEIIEKLKKTYNISKSKLLEKTIKDIITQLKQNSTENSWDEFRKHFENVHNDFFVQLNKKYPELTQNDLKICAFIRLNMVSKDIALITGLSPKSIDVTRYRIRKKMKLNKNDNLYKFLSDI